MRFAGSPTARNRGYDFSPSVNYSIGVGMTGGGGSAGAGSIVPALYNKVASTGFQPGDTLKTSLATRAEEKAAATEAEARVKMARMSADATVEAAKLQADAAKDAANEQSSGAMMGSVLGTVGSIGAALLSDETTKDNIRPLHYALEVLRELKPVTFHYNEEYSTSPERLHHGFIAQEFQKVLPDATYFDESTSKLCIDTGDLIGILVRAVQELEGRVSRMEATQYLAGVK